jgi:hypothetical protein
MTNASHQKLIFDHLSGGQRLVKTGTLVFFFSELIVKK